MRVDIGGDMVACQAAGHRVESLGDIPLHVLTASTFLYPPRFPPHVGQPIQAVWEGLQGEFPKLSSRAPECGHFIQIDRPQAVVGAISRVVAAVRKG